MAEGLTCPICLRADEPESMIGAVIERSLYKQTVRVKLCRDCAFAIAGAVQASGELPPWVEPIEPADKQGEKPWNEATHSEAKSPSSTISPAMPSPSSAKATSKR